MPVIVTVPPAVGGTGVPSNATVCDFVPLPPAEATLRLPPGSSPRPAYDACTGLEYVTLNELGPAIAMLSTAAGAGMLLVAA